jgi:uncharacterized membrane protein
VFHAFKRLHDDTVVDLGTLPGFTNSAARRINDAGVVVGSALTGPGSPRAVWWEPDGTIHDLGQGAAWDVNERGVVVGERDRRGFAFDPATGQTIAMPDLPGTLESTALGVNAHDQVVGYQLSSGQRTGVVWDLGSGVVHAVDAGGAQFLPAAIDDAGNLAGVKIVGPPTFPVPVAAYLAVGTTTPVELGAGFGSVALATDDGVVVASNATERRAYRWSVGSGLVEVGVGTEAIAADVNRSGNVVGQADGRAVFFGVPPG